MQMVKSANMNGLLDSDSDSLSSCQHRVKARLHEIMQKDAEFCEEDYEKVKHSVASLLPVSERRITMLQWFDVKCGVCEQWFG